MASHQEGVALLLVEVAVLMLVRTALGPAVESCHLVHLDHCLALR